MNKKIVKLAEKKLKMANKWLDKFEDYDVGHMDGTLEGVKSVRKVCKKILKHEKRWN